MALSGLTSVTACGGETEPQPCLSPPGEPPAEVRDEPQPAEPGPGATGTSAEPSPLAGEGSMPMPCLIGAIPGEDGTLGGDAPGGGLGTLGQRGEPEGTPPVAP